MSIITYATDVALGTHCFEHPWTTLGVISLNIRPEVHTRVEDLVEVFLIGDRPRDAVSEHPYRERSELAWPVILQESGHVSSLVHVCVAVFGWCLEVDKLQFDCLLINFEPRPIFPEETAYLPQVT